MSEHVRDWSSCQLCLWTKMFSWLRLAVKIIVLPCSFWVSTVLGIHTYIHSLRLWQELARLLRLVRDLLPFIHLWLVLYSHLYIFRQRFFRVLQLFFWLPHSFISFSHWKIFEILIVIAVSWGWIASPGLVVTLGGCVWCPSCIAIDFPFAERPF